MTIAADPLYAAKRKGQGVVVWLCVATTPCVVGAALLSGASLVLFGTLAGHFAGSA